MGWGAALGIAVLLAVLPLGIRVSYGGEGALVQAVCGPVRITLFPRKKKEKKKKEEANPAPQAQEPPRKEAASKSQPPAPPEKKEKKGGSLMDFLPLLQMGLELLGDLRRKLRVEELYLRLILAASDPCDLAVNYGRAWAAVGNLMPRLERLLAVKKRDVEVECDFTASQTLVIARLEITVTLGRLLVLVMVYGIRGLMEYLKIQKKRKGGAIT